ncbi:hypothetical protein F4677DRAFT_251475 [Hypoxylon crocopeplum]|nr:hypothetical protein F4677DRAFT_251475 [Hypoxylon crocopeplum]
MATKEHLDVKKSFNWLRREARGPTYISYSEISDRLACSFEFGENGCAASCNYGGELLHMSAKDDEKGIIFAHGDFESTYYSSLARAQRQHGGQATFGLGIAANQEPYHTADDPMDRGSNVTIGPMMERGSFNYRWPFNEYVLRLNEKDSSNPKETGTCARVSFVKDDILYQVIRLEKGCRLEADVCHYVPWRGQVVLSVGGLIKFSAFGTDNACAGVEEYGVPELSSQSILGSTTQLDIRVRQLNGDEYDTLDLNLPGDKNQRPDKQGGQYYACAELPERKDIMSQEGKQAIFVAEFRLRNAGPQPQWPETPTSEQIYAHLGIDSYSKMATGVMWETIFLQREERTGYFSESSEVNLIGRSVEKILTVDLVPTAFGGQGDTFEETSPLALVSNLFLRPSVDLESLFWKVRFLAKAYRFLSSFKLLTSPDTYLKPSFNDSSDEMDMAYLQSTAPSISRTEHHRYGTKSAWNKIEVMMNAVNFQMERLQEAIERILSYLVRAFIQPETQSNSMSLVTRAFQSNYYYVMITIWYIVKKCERFGFTWKWADGMKTWPTGSCLLENCIPPDNLLPEDKEKEKVTFLKWYHYASVLNLMARKKPLLPKVWQTKNLDMKVNLLERDARRAAAAKLSSSQPYSAEDEILDRLGFLAEALHAEYSKGRAGSVASITVRRILGRDSTRRLNPGRLPSGEKGQVSGPWEIHALCHHSRLLVENYQYNKEGDRTREQKAEDAERYRGMISQFLNAEACLVPCWERTNMASFQSEATSVLASTLLGICQKDFILTLGPNEGGELASRQGDAKSVPPPPSPRLKTDFSYPFPQTPGPKLNSREYPTERLSIKPQTTDMKRPRAIEWLRYRPPRQYHHASFFNSLDDTPQLFTISNVDERTSALLSSLPNINGEPYSQMEFDMMSINRMLEGHQMSIIDLKASVPDQWNSHTWKGYRSELSTLDKYDSSRANEGTRRADLQKLEKMLSDSLVDQEVQHRTIILSG